MTHDMVDPILQGELDQILPHLQFIKKGVAFTTVDSTNEEALQFEKRGADSGMVVAGARQTKGRGRLQRTWYTNDGDVALSIMLRPPFVPAVWSLIAFMPAMAAVRGLETLGIDVRCKWPNDLIIKKKSTEHDVPYFAEFRKIGGILVENVFMDTSLSACIIGLGLNLSPIDSLKQEIPHIATLIDVAPTLTRARCITAVLLAFDQILASLMSADFSTKLICDYSKYCETLGRDVEVQTPTTTIRGRAVRLDNDGALIINDGLGEQTIRAGDVTFMRK